MKRIVLNYDTIEKMYIEYCSKCKKQPRTFDSFFVTIHKLDFHRTTIKPKIRSFSY